jgi:hypothetical protein
MAARVYRYVGPAEFAALAQNGVAGHRIDSVAGLAAWVEASAELPAHDGLTPATFVVDRDQALRLAPRGSEHVACAEGGDVLAAGEMFFDGVEVVEVTNQSTGYCPEPESWVAVAHVLGRLGVQHPSGYTSAFVFRRCDGCGELNVVKDGWFECEICGHALPQRWNCDPQVS